MCFVVFIVFYVYKHAKTVVLVCGSDWSTCGFHDAVGEYVAFCRAELPYYFGMYIGNYSVWVPRLGKHCVPCTYTQGTQ
jgi:hypothetical protein